MKTGFIQFLQTFTEPIYLEDEEVEELRISSNP